MIRRVDMLVGLTNDGALFLGKQTNVDYGDNVTPLPPPVVFMGAATRR